MPVISTGWCAPGLEGVQSAFDENFLTRGEVGAGLVVMVGGEVVVDLSGGLANPVTGAEWNSSTLVDVYSVGKAFIGLAALRAVDAGLTGLDEPIGVIWPEYATLGKESTTLRHALCHQAGVPAIRTPLSNEDLWSFESMTRALEITVPWWVPGERLGYHTNTYGHLVGEVVRRLTGMMPSEAIATVAAEVGADVFVGAPPSEWHRCAEVLFDAPVDPEGLDLTGLEGDDLMVALSYFNPPGYSSIGVANSEAWRRAEVPSTNMHASASGVARIYDGLLTEGRLISPALLDEATRVQSEGWCPVLGEDVRFGLGFKPTVPRRPFGPNPSAFGHFGTGGSVGFADPEAQVAFGYVMNHVIPRWQSSRNRALIDALYAAL